MLKKETHFSLLIWNNQSYWLFMYFLTNIPFHKISTFITQVIIWIEPESIKINVWLLEKPFALNSLKQNQAVLHWREKLTSTTNGQAIKQVLFLVLWKGKIKVRWLNICQNANQGNSGQIRITEGFFGKLLDSATHRSWSGKMSQKAKSLKCPKSFGSC